VEISDELFRSLLQESLDDITQQVQKHAARYNNRGFMHLVTGKVANRGDDFVEEDIPSPEVAEDFDSVEEEVKKIEEFFESHSELQARTVHAEAVATRDLGPPV